MSYEESDYCYSSHSSYHEDKCEELKQIIEQKDKQLEALRGFANELFETCGEWFLEDLLIKYGLTDKQGNPTPLLKGE